MAVVVALAAARLLASLDCEPASDASDPGTRFFATALFGSARNVSRRDLALTPDMARSRRGGVGTGVGAGSPLIQLLEKLGPKGVQPWSALRSRFPCRLAGACT